MRLSRTESHDIVIQRHLVAARTRRRARNKGQLSVGPQTEIPVPKHGGDLAEKLEAAEDERQAVADEATRDLELHVDVWRGRGAAVPEQPQHLAPAHALSNADSYRPRLHECIDEVDPRSDTQRHVIAGEPRKRRRWWIMRRR